MTPTDRFLDQLRWLWVSMGDHLLQATAFTVLVAVAALVCRRAAARHALWLMAAAKFAVPSFVIAALLASSGLDRWLRLPERGEAVPGASVVAGALAPIATAASVRVHDGRSALHGVLALVWFAGALAVATTVWRRRSVLRRAVCGASAVRPGRATQALARAARRHGINRVIPLVETPAVPEPAVFGVFRPVIALPKGLVERLGGDDLELIFLHETAHVRRRDTLVAGLSLMLCTILWFWPVVWWVHRRLLAERELACDEDVVVRCGRPAGYLACLLKVCRLSIGRRGMLELATFGGSDLGHRAESIEALARRPFGRGLARAIVAFGVVALLAVSICGIAGSAGVRARGGFENDALAPLRIVRAEVPSFGAEAGRPMVELLNVSGQRVVRVKLRFKTDAPSHVVMARAVDIPPGGSIAMSPGLPVEGDTAELRVQLLGVRFENGRLWGAFDTAIDSRWERVDVPQYVHDP